MGMQGKISILDLKKFITPLKAISNSVGSVILTKEGDTFMVNAATADANQISNIHFKNTTVKITEGADSIDKLGIFDLGQFLNALSTADGNAVDIIVNNNILSIKYSEKSSLNYMLSDLNLITEGPDKLKKEPTWITTIEINSAFIKKVKSVSSSIGGNIIRFIGKDGKFRYTIGDRNNHSHNFNETLIEDGVSEDFEVLLSIRDDKRDNFSFLLDSCSYKLSIHDRLIQLVAVTEDYELIRFYLSPLKDSE